jgi:hypothetical protein
MTTRTPSGTSVKTAFPVSFEPLFEEIGTCAVTDREAPSFSVDEPLLAVDGFGAEPPQPPINDAVIEASTQKTRIDVMTPPFE